MKIIKITFLALFFPAIVYASASISGLLTNLYSKIISSFFLFNLIIFSVYIIFLIISSFRSIKKKDDSKLPGTVISKYVGLVFIPACHFVAITLFLVGLFADGIADQRSDLTIIVFLAVLATIQGIIIYKTVKADIRILTAFLLFFLLNLLPLLVVPAAIYLFDRY